MNMNDPVEIEMLYTQSVTDVFEEKIPLTKQDAVSHNVLCVHSVDGSHNVLFVLSLCMQALFIMYS